MLYEGRYRFHLLFEIDIPVNPTISVSNWRASSNINSSRERNLLIGKSDKNIE